jgi:ankyrin repeat protein
MNIFDAAENGRIDELKKLVKKVDINIQNENGLTPLFFAAQLSNYSSSIETVKWLLNNGANPNIQNKAGWTPLNFIVFDTNTTSSVDSVKLLLDAGADINLAQEDKWSPLMFAVKYSGTTSTINTVKLLLERGADVNQLNKDNMNSLFIGVLNITSGKSSFEVVQLLLDKGIDIDTQDFKGRTVLMLAASQNDVVTVKILLENKANVNLKNDSGQTALDLSNDSEIIKMLLKAGSKCNDCGRIERIIEENKIKQKPYRKIKFLGKGKEGVVYEIEKDGLRYAMKDIIKTKDIIENEKIREINYLQKKLDHPNISKVFEIYEDDKNIVLIMELCQEDMKQFLLKTKLTIEEILSIFKQLVSAVKYLEERNILHSDIKIMNILMCLKDNKIVPKLIDFGSATINPEKGSDRYIGYLDNMAPEMCQNNYSYEVDIWQLGVVLYYMVFNDSPFPELKTQIDKSDYCYNYIKYYKFQLPKVGSGNYQIDDLIIKMLQPDPKKRPSIVEIMEYLN